MTTGDLSGSPLTRRDYSDPKGYDTLCCKKKKTFIFIFEMKPLQLWVSKITLGWKGIIIWNSYNTKEIEFDFEIEAWTYLYNA